MISVNDIGEKARERLIELLLKLFVIRSDCYVLQSTEPDKRGRYVFRKIGKQLTRGILREHLDGNLTVGIYQIDPNERAVKWIVYDVDGTHVSNPEQVIRALLGAIQTYKLPYALEASSSPSSYHVWIFIKLTKIKVAYEFARKICREANVSSASLEIFPKSPHISGGGFGNCVKLPFGVNWKTKKRSCLLDPLTFRPLTYQESLEFLEKVEPIDLPPQSIQSIQKDSNLLNKLRARIKRVCFIRAYEERLQLDGPEGNDFRLAALHEMLGVGFDDEEIHEYFRGQQDYEFDYTQEKINYSRTKEYKPYRCSTLYTKCGSIVSRWCGDCPYSKVNKEDCLRLLKSPDLLQQIVDHIHRELVNETNNVVSLFLAGVSSKTRDPLNIDVVGDSSTGKSKLTCSVMKLFDNASIVGSMSKTSLVHEYTTKVEAGYRIVNLSQTIIVILERENSEEFLNFLKPLTAHDSQETEYKITEPSTKGRHFTQKIKLRGWPVLITVSTRTTKPEEQATRAWTISPNQSEEKYRTVNLDTVKRSMFGSADLEARKEEQIIKKALGMLRFFETLNPFAFCLYELFPHKEPRSMGDLKRAVTLINASTVLHQYQRLRIQKDGKEYLIATIDDYKLAIKLINTLLATTLTGIPNHVREFFDKVIMSLHREGAQITIKSMQRKYREVYGRVIAESSLKTRYLYPLRDFGRIYVDDEHKKPHTYSVNIVRIVKDHQDPSDGVFEDENVRSQYDKFLEEISKIVRSSGYIYKGDERISLCTIDDIKAYLDKYIHTVTIGQSLLSELEKDGAREVDRELPTIVKRTLTIPDDLFDNLRCAGLDTIESDVLRWAYGYIKTYPGAGLDVFLRDFVHHREEKYARHEIKRLFEVLKDPERYLTKQKDKERLLKFIRARQKIVPEDTYRYLRFAHDYLDELLQELREEDKVGIELFTPPYKGCWYVVK